MNETWLQAYILLAFRIHKVVQETYGAECLFVESYYGPQGWREQTESEPQATPADLVRQATTLLDALPAQNFPANREIYLAKHVRAMVMMCRKLCGETFSLEEEARDFLDIQPVWTSEERFEQAHALYDTILPGTGSITERRRAYGDVIAYPKDQAHLLPQFIDLAFTEARERTRRLIELPAGETFDIEYRPDWEHEAAAYYRGNYQTQIVMNVAATGTSLSRLFDHKVCHEGYPGHHTEYTLKEQHIYRQQGYVEQSLLLTLCPQCVIQEGIATTAHEMIFAEGEAEQWLAEHVYRPLNRDVDPLVLLRLRQASQMLEGVWHNAAILLDEGRSDQEVAQYFTRYMMLTEDTARSMVALLQHPIWGRNQLTYASGYRLMQRHLQGSDKIALFRRVLTEQITPSQLAT